MSQLIVQGKLAAFMTPYADVVRVSGGPVDVMSPEAASHVDRISPRTAGSVEALALGVKQAL